MHDNHSLVGIPLVAVFRISLIQLLQTRFGIFDQAVVTDLHQLRVIDGQMSGACEMVQIRLEDLLSCFGTLNLLFLQPHID